MKAFACAAFLLVLAAPIARTEPVNFQLSSFAPEVPEGPVRERSYFEVGHRRISFRPPYHGRLSSAADGLSIFLDEKGLSGQIRIGNSTLTPAVDFNTQIEDYRQAGEGTLPKEAEKPEMLGAKYDIVTVNGWKSVGLEWKYTQAARPTHREVAWLNLDSEHQICVTIVSDEDYWKETSAVARRFLTSWYWVSDSAR